MENTDYLNIVRCFAVKNHMPPNMMITIALFNIMASSAHIGVICNQVKTIIQLAQIYIALTNTPCFLSLAANRFKVGFGRLGQMKTRHTSVLSLSNSFITSVKV